MTRRQIAVVCYIAGLTVVGANLVVDAVGRRFYNCDRDPYFPQACTAQEWIYLGVIVTCWLVATYVIARRDAIGPFACAVMGLMLWFGAAAFGVLLQYVRNSPWGNDWVSDAWVIVLVGVFVAMPVIGLFTAPVGLWMQATIRDRRRKRRSRAEREGTGRALMNSRRLIAFAILVTLATAGVFMSSLGVPPSSGSPMVGIVVSEVDIPAGTDLDRLIKDDRFRLIVVPLAIVDDGTVTSVDQLRHKRARVVILTGEWIQASRLKTEAERASS
jgi:hypothetical protein